MPMHDAVYLHLRKDPVYWRRAFKVVKMAKSTDAEVTPGDVVVKVKITIPDSFFDDAMPTIELALDPEKAVPFAVEQEGLDFSDFQPDEQVDPEDEA